jgi:hypothetical protein
MQKLVNQVQNYFLRFTREPDDKHPILDGIVVTLGLLLAMLAGGITW